MSLAIDDNRVCLTPTPLGPCGACVDVEGVFCSNGHHAGVAGYRAGPVPDDSGAGASFGGTPAS